jgi:hypothetical protein
MLGPAGYPFCEARRQGEVMNNLYFRLRWMIPVCALVLFVATSAFADEAPSPDDWLAWLLWFSRIGVPGG